MTAKVPPDPVRRYLIERGVRPDLAREGLAGLVERWTTIVDEVSRGYQLTLDDYVNDMDVRDIIAGALRVADSKERVAIASALDEADRKLRGATKPSPSLLGYATDVPNPPNPTNPPTNPPNPENLPNPDRWWYRCRPKKAGPALIRDLETLLSE